MRDGGRAERRKAVSRAPLVSSLFQRRPHQTAWTAGVSSVMRLFLAVSLVSLCCWDRDGRSRRFITL